MDCPTLLISFDKQLNNLDGNPIRDYNKYIILSYKRFNLLLSLYVKVDEYTLAIDLWNNNTWSMCFSFWMKLH